MESGNSPGRILASGYSMANTGIWLFDDFTSTVTEVISVR